MTDKPVPPWKFWHPIAFWQVLVVLLVAQLVSAFVVVTAREGLGLPVPQWVIGGAGGVLGWLGVMYLVRRKRRAG